MPFVHCIAWGFNKNFSTNKITQAQQIISTRVSKVLLQHNSINDSINAITLVTVYIETT